MTRRQGQLTVGEVQLYYECCGSGPTALLIPPGPGDCGEYEALVRHLASDFTVLTYDRRGFSRSSPVPADATIAASDHATDAAGLLDSLGLGPAAVVFGLSAGAIVAIELALQAPSAVGRVIAFEPPLLADTPGGEEVRGELTRIEQDAMESTGDPAQAYLAFTRHTSGDAFDRLDQDLQERLLGNATAFFAHDVADLAMHRFDSRALRSLETQTVVAAGTSTGAWMQQCCDVLARRIGCPSLRVEAGHSAHLDDPATVASLIRRVAVDTAH